MTEQLYDNLLILFFSLIQGFCLKVIEILLSWLAFKVVKTFPKSLMNLKCLEWNEFCPSIAAIMINYRRNSIMIKYSKMTNHVS